MKRIYILATCIVFAFFLSGCKTMDNFLNKSTFALIEADAPLNAKDVLAGKDITVQGDILVARIPKGEKFHAEKKADGTWIAKVNK